MPVINRPYNNYFETGVLYPSDNPEMYGPFPPAPPDSGEFGPLQFVQSSVSKVTANVSRIFDSTKDVSDQNDQPAWWNLSARISNTASALNSAFQSTLIKIIILVAIVGVVAVFGMSYVQAKGVNLAK